MQPSQLLVQSPKKTWEAHFLKKSAAGTGSQMVWWEWPGQDHHVAQIGQPLSLLNYHWASSGSPKQLSAFHSLDTGSSNAKGLGHSHNIREDQCGSVCSDETKWSACGFALSMQTCSPASGHEPRSVNNGVGSNNYPRRTMYVCWARHEVATNIKVFMFYQYYLFLELLVMWSWIFDKKYWFVGNICFLFVLLNYCFFGNIGIWTNILKLFVKLTFDQYFGNIGPDQ